MIIEKVHSFVERSQATFEKIEAFVERTYMYFILCAASFYLGVVTTGIAMNQDRDDYIHKGYEYSNEHNEHCVVYDGNPSVKPFQSYCVPKEQ